MTTDDVLKKNLYKIFADYHGLLVGHNAPSSHLGCWQGRCWQGQACSLAVLTDTERHICLPHPTWQSDNIDSGQVARLGDVGTELSDSVICSVQCHIRQVLLTSHLAPGSCPQHHHWTEILRVCSLTSALAFSRLSAEVIPIWRR